MTSPVERHSPSSSSSSHLNSPGSFRHARHSKWINPCKISDNPSPSKAMSPADNVHMYRNIIDATHKAITHSMEFMPRYYKETFGDEFDPLHLKDLHPEFLGDLPDRINKYLGEDVTPEKLASLEVDSHLREMYEGLQKFSVGLEQIVLDQSVYGGSFHANFHECEFKLKYVLCELQLGLYDKSIPYTDQKRDLMEQKYRDIDSSTQRNIRDWLIFRDYVTTLEYVLQTFKYFAEQAENAK